MKRGGNATLLLGKCSHTGKLIEGKDGSGRIICSIIINNKNYCFLAHQFIWFYCGNTLPFKPFVIDHINQDPLNNRITNLRIITQQKNTFNTNAKGYCWYKNKNKFQAQIMLNGESIYLGDFLTESEASEAYQNAKKIYHKIN